MARQSIEVLKETKSKGLISLKVSFGAFIHKEKPKMYSSYCPALHICSQGQTVKEAKESLKDAIWTFISYCFENGILTRELERQGFVLEGTKLAKSKPKPKTKTPKPPFRGGTPHQIPMEIPLTRFAA